MATLFQAPLQLPLLLRGLQAPQKELRALNYTCATTTVMTAVALKRPSVIFVTPNGFCGDIERAKDITRAAFDGGASIVQIRDRYADKHKIISTVKSMLEEDFPLSRLTINGLTPREVANISTQLGVHVREADIDDHLAQAKDVLASTAIVGCSIHSASSAQRSLKIRPPDYFQIGTMFATGSHPGKVPEGPSLLRDVRKVVGNSSHLVGVGGINKENLRHVFENSADGIAVISFIASAKNPTAATSELVRICKSTCGA